LFLGDRAVNSDKHCTQLDRPRETTATKRYGFANRENVIFRRGNARPLGEKYNYIDTVKKSSKNILTKKFYSDDVSLPKRWEEVMKQE
ncbi:unnamed protein product, partial [Heterotrigona itama]